MKSQAGLCWKKISSFNAPLFHLLSTSIGILNPRIKPILSWNTNYYKKNFSLVKPKAVKTLLINVTFYLLGIQIYGNIYQSGIYPITRISTCYYICAGSNQLSGLVLIIIYAGSNQLSGLVLVIYDKTLLLYNTTESSVIKSSHLRDAMRS